MKQRCVKAKLRLGGLIIATSAISLLLVACGGGTSAAGSTAGAATGGPAFSGGGPGGAIVAGTVNAVSGDTVTVTASGGDDQFQLSASTTILKVESATESDLAQGEFALVRGQRNQDGTVTATSVQVGQQPQGGFGTGSQFGAGGGGPRFGGGTPPQFGGGRPSGAPRRSFGAGSGGTVAGTIAAVGGGDVTISTNRGGNAVVQIPASASILAAVSASAADITPGQTILARGQRDASGMLAADSVQVGLVNLPGQN